MKLLVVFIILFGFIPLNAQPYGSHLNEKTGTLSNSRIKFGFSNNGVVAQPRNWVPVLSWMHENNGYYSDLSFIASMKVKMTDETDFTHPIIQSLLNTHSDSTFYSSIITNVSRPAVSQEVSPQGTSWSFGPLAGYFNDTQNLVATSDKPESWPDTWTQFPSYFPDRKNEFTETFFVLDDHPDEEFNLPPFNHNPLSDNPERNGLGIRSEVRYLLPDPSIHGPIQDVLFLVHRFINESDYDYSDFMFSYIVGQYIGISGFDDSPWEYEDDVCVYDTTTHTMYSYDFSMDNSRNPKWIGKTGYTGIRLIGPGSFQSGSYFAPSNNINLKDDEKLREQLELITPAYTPVIRGEDCDGLVSSGRHFFGSGDTLEFVSMVAFTFSRETVDKVLDMGANLFENSFDYSGVKFVHAQTPSEPLKNTSNQIIPIKTGNLTAEDSCQIFAFDQITNTEHDLGKYSLNSNDLVVDLSGLRSGNFQFTITPINTDILPSVFLADISHAGPSMQIPVGDTTDAVIQINTNPFFISKSDTIDITLKRTFEFTWTGPQVSSIQFHNRTTGQTYGPFPGTPSGEDLYFNTVNGLGVTISKAGQSDIATTYNSFGDFIKFSFSSSQIRMGSKIAVFSKRLDFKITKGIDTSIAGIVGSSSIQSVLTPFTITSPEGKKIPFLFLNKQGTTNDLGYGDEVFLLYDSGISTSWQDTIGGLQNSSYRFAQRFLIYSDSLNANLDSAEFRYTRAFKGIKTLTLTGENLLSESDEVPVLLQISNPYPNPFNPSVSIRIQSPIRQQADFKVYNLLGQLVGTWNQQLNTGETVVNWIPTQGLSSGVYFLRISAGNQLQIRKAVFLK